MVFTDDDCLPHITVTGHASRRPALLDVARWFSYQTAQRLWPQLRRRDPCPPELTLRELAGGLAALAGFWLYARRAPPAPSPRPGRPPDVADSPIPPDTP